MAFINTFANGALGSAVRAIINNLVARANSTGWANYLDTEYSDGSPFALTGNDTYVTLPNNAGSKLEGQLPQDITKFYDEVGQTLEGLNGDGVSLTIEMTARPVTATVTYLDVGIDIGGAVGIIYPRTITFPKGNGVDRTFSFSFTGYQLDTWEANGGTVKVKANANMEIYGVRYVITRTHKAR